MMLEIVLPVPMPTWNRLLAMHPMERMKCRNLLHLFVSLSYMHGNDWPTWTTFQSRERSTDVLLVEYLQMIRPSKSRKSELAKLRRIEKVQSSKSR